MVVNASLSLLVLLATAALPFGSAFVVQRHGTTKSTTCTTSTSLSATVESQSQSRSSPPQRPLRQVLVVGDVPAAMGAALALHCFEVLTGRTKIPSEHQMGSPPQQPVTLFTANNLNDLESNILRQTEPILHLPIDVSGTGANNILTPQVCSGLGFLGIQPSPYDTQGPLVSADTARQFSGVLQNALNRFPTSHQSSDKASSFVTLDLSLQLAMLQANCLPKSSSHQDTYHVLTPEGGSILVHYLYDDQNFAGGNDPLSCNTQETVLSTPPTFASAKRSTTSGAAYTALRGNGMDPVSSAAIAGAVSTILGDAGGNNHITWTSIQQTVQLSKHIREFGAVDTPGAVRRQYTDYGYK